MDVHRSMKGVTSDQLMEAHNADLAVQHHEAVNFKHAWADPDSRMVFCLSDGAERRRRAEDPRALGRPADEIYEVSVQA